MTSPITAPISCGNKCPWLGIVQSVTSGQRAQRREPRHDWYASSTLAKRPRRLHAPSTSGIRGTIPSKRADLIKNGGRREELQGIRGDLLRIANAPGSTAGFRIAVPTREMEGVVRVPGREDIVWRMTAGERRRVLVVGDPG